MSEKLQKIIVLIVGALAIIFILFSSSQSAKTIDDSFWPQNNDLDITAQAGVDFQYFEQWPELDAYYPLDEILENRITQIMSSMSLEQKIGQMIQVNIKTESAEEVNQFNVGNLTIDVKEQPGRGSKAKLSNWLQALDEYWVANTFNADGLEHFYVNDTLDNTFKKENPIAPLWFVDAIHGNSNVFGSVIFPHNINLGMANDPLLVEKIGQATALQVLAAGQNVAMVSSPTVVRDDRWGRVYEGYSEHPEISMNLTAAMIKGLNADNAGAISVASGVKHYLAAGDTHGVDRGDTQLSQAELISLHAQSYMAAIKNGVQVIAIGLNSVNGEKNHGSKFLIQNVLKDKMNFDGIVTTDWQGASYVFGCWEGRCAKAINAGIDVFLIPTTNSQGRIDRVDNFKTFICTTIKQVKSGKIKLTRIDDAVRRVLRVKIRTGVFDAPKPSLRDYAGDKQLLDNPNVRALAREVVAKSLVLLKNDRNILPLNRYTHILIAGDGVQQIKSATGGYSMGYNSAGGDSKYPAGIKFINQIKQVAQNVTYKNSKILGRMTEEKFDPYDVIVLMLKEPIYAGISGDINTLDFSKLYAKQFELFEKLQQTGKPLIVLYFGGRPLYMNPILNQSDAFVAVWYPGTEVSGVTDVIFRNDKNEINKDFTGKLSFSWPKTPCQFENNIGQFNYDPLFKFGFGLTYQDFNVWQPLADGSKDCEQ
ncbi:MAG: glycoside hydrolase family 3 protein [Saccharospirillaceae bacterium]|nr:glycoside hydrolase family 3 C-terminal domain-containing protein [Pseudomonadales bacterium]NRB77864.1 glycoside hydrolase family 3 protein [Saccharospirillaceae bacterium]